MSSTSSDCDMVRVLLALPAPSSILMPVRRAAGNLSWPRSRRRAQLPPLALEVHGPGGAADGGARRRGDGEHVVRARPPVERQAAAAARQDVAHLAGLDGVGE